MYDVSIIGGGVIDLLEPLQRKMLSPNFSTKQYFRLAEKLRSKEKAEI